MIDPVTYKTNTASLLDIEDHFQSCPDVIANLSQRVNIEVYSEKIRKFANTYEAWSSIGKLVGLIACYANDPDGSMAFITNVSVLPRFRRNGISRHLLEKLVEDLVVGGFEEVDLETDENNLSALNLYKSLDFKEFKKNGASVFMRKLL